MLEHIFNRRPPAVRRGGIKLWCFVALALSALFAALPIRPGVVIGESMFPTFKDGQIFLMRLLRDPKSLHRGDVVIFTIGGETCIKRVAGLPGDRLWGLDFDEMAGKPDYVTSDPKEIARLQRLVQASPAVGRVMEVVVPPRSVYVLGDATNNSYDSRYFGPVPLDAIKGRVVVASLFDHLRLRGAGYAHAATHNPKAHVPR